MPDNKFVRIETRTPSLPFYFENDSHFAEILWGGIWYFRNDIQRFSLVMLG